MTNKPFCPIISIHTPPTLRRLGSRATPNRVALAFYKRSWMKTNVYIDGFNLYYGCLKGTPHRWLDLAAFCQASFPPPRNQINRIRYFTAQSMPGPIIPSNVSGSRHICVPCGQYRT